MRLLLLLLALSVAPLSAAGAADHHRSKRGIADYLTGLIYRASDIVFRSFAEASGYKVTKLPPKATEKSFHSEQHQSKEMKTSGKSHTKEKKTSFATTTERIVSMGESYSTKSGPFKSDYNHFYSSEDGNSDFDDHWPTKKPADHDDEEEKRADFNVWIHDDAKPDREEESNNKVQVHKRRPSRIKLHRKGEEETVHYRHLDKQGPNLGLGSGSAESRINKKPMIIRVLTPTPPKQPEGSLEDSWPSVWRGAH